MFGCVFVLIGIFVVIPAAGAFGVLWTLIAAGGTAYNAYVAFGKKYIGPEIRIEDEAAASEDPESACASYGSSTTSGSSPRKSTRPNVQEILGEL